MGAKSPIPKADAGQPSLRISFGSIFISILLSLLLALLLAERDPVLGFRNSCHTITTKYDVIILRYGVEQGEMITIAGGTRDPNTQASYHKDGMGPNLQRGSHDRAPIYCNLTVLYILSAFHYSTVSLHLYLIDPLGTCATRNQTYQIDRASSAKLPESLGLVSFICSQDTYLLISSSEK